MILETVITLVADQFSVDEDEITEDTLFEDLDAEDMDIADLILAVEDEFEIDISADEANELSGVSDLTDLVETALGLR